MVEFFDFYADWCGPCQASKPIIEELEKEFAGKVEFRKVNVDQDQELSAKYGVLSIPTFVILKDGQEVDRVVGMMGKESLKGKIEAQLKQCK